MRAPNEIEQQLDNWDPATGDLPDVVARWLDRDDALRARFDARFERWEAGDASLPVGLEARVVDDLAARRRSRARMHAGVRLLLAATVMGVIGVTASSMVGTSLTTNFSTIASNIDDEPAPRAWPEVPSFFRGAQGDAAAPPASMPRPSTNQPTDAAMQRQLQSLGYQSNEGDLAIDATVTTTGGLLPNDNQANQVDFATLVKGNNGEGEHGAAKIGTTGDGFVDAGVNGFVTPEHDPLSTFSIDVDRGSYTFGRGRLHAGFLPDPASVRVEEYVNALTYRYAPPEEGPFAVQFEASPSPFRADSKLVRIGVQGTLPASRPPVHLTFLVDTSGSMGGADRLGLVQNALVLLVDQLGDGDTVALVTYAGSAGVALAPTPATQTREIQSAIQNLQSGGSTAMGTGIELAYRLADKTRREGHINRVIIASDGDTNVGVTDTAQLTQLIEGYADKGVTLTTIGVGQGNYKDARMEQLANDGDGNYYYLDTAQEAHRVFVEELAGTLEVIARDVKIQVEWNADTVRRYRLIGYENRAIADRDFRNDAVDAGEIGAGHAVTALYEVELLPVGSGDIATVRLRAKPPGAEASSTERTFTLPMGAVHPTFLASSNDHRMAVAAATFAERLRGSPYVTGVSYGNIAALAQSAQREGMKGDAELIDLTQRAARLTGEVCNDRGDGLVDTFGAPCEWR